MLHPKIDVNFESANFVVHSINDHSMVGEIRKDSNNIDFQWFYFSVETGCEKLFEIRINNICLSSYPTAWDGFQVAAKHDGEVEWKKLNTKIKNNSLVFNVLIKNKIWFAYFQPYTLEQHARLSDRFSKLKGFFTKVSAKTKNNLAIDLFQLAHSEKNPDRKNIWIIARQHSGESITGWFMEGIATVFESENIIGNALLNRYQFFIVHNANPDGVAHGMHRTNTTGSDLNREWFSPSLEACPEIVAIKQWMQEYPPDIFLDVHGDERTLHPYFLVNPHTISESDNQFLKRLSDSHSKFEIRLQHNQKIDLSMGRHSVEYQFNCLALTLELPCQNHINLQSNLINFVKILSYDCLKALLP